MDGRLPGNIIPWQRLMSVPKERFLEALNSENPSAAYRALQEMGPDGVEFGDVLIEHLRQKSYQSGLIDASASVLRHDPRLIKKLLNAFWSLPSPHPYPGMIPEVIAETGPACAEVDSGLVAKLLKVTHSPEARTVASCAEALGGVTRGTDVAVARLIELTRHDEEIVQGIAIDALGNVGSCPETVVPHLVELLDTFREYDPDTSMYGEHTRIAEALIQFGPEVVRELPRILEHFPPPPKYRHGALDLDDGLLRLLRSLGPAANQALPVLEKCERHLVANSSDADLALLRTTIAAVKGLPWEEVE